MVGMIVGDEHRTYFLKRDTVGLQGCLEGAQAHSGIDQERAAAAFEPVAVAVAAAGKAHHPHCLTCLHRFHSIS